MVSFWASGGGGWLHFLPEKCVIQGDVEVLAITFLDRMRILRRSMLDVRSSSIPFLTAERINEWFADDAYMKDRYHIDEASCIEFEVTSRLKSAEPASITISGTIRSHEQVQS